MHAGRWSELNGTVREGQWQQDRLDGQGRAEEADGTWYEGGFDAGRRGGAQPIELPPLQASAVQLYVTCTP